jgi:excisionase family DNA binding protein
MRSNQAQLTELLLTDAEVAILLAISRRQVWRLVNTGELPPPIRFGRSTRWRRNDIERCLNNK